VLVGACCLLPEILRVPVWLNLPYEPKQLSIFCLRALWSTWNDTEKISMAPALRMTRSIKEKLPIFCLFLFSLHHRNPHLHEGNEASYLEPKSASAREVHGSLSGLFDSSLLPLFSLFFFWFFLFFFFPVNFRVFSLTTSSYQLCLTGGSPLTSRNGDLQHPFFEQRQRQDSIIVNLQ
jgi:hypothetical protein